MHDSMLKKLEQLQNRINEIQDLLLDSKTIEDIDKYTLLNKEFSELKPIVEKFDEYNNVLKSIKDANEIIESGDKSPNETIDDMNCDAMFPSVEYCSKSTSSQGCGCNFEREMAR